MNKKQMLIPIKIKWHRHTSHINVPIIPQEGTSCWYQTGRFGVYCAKYIILIPGSIISPGHAEVQPQFHFHEIKALNDFMSSPL